MFENLRRIALCICEERQNVLGLGGRIRPLNKSITTPEPIVALDNYLGKWHNVEQSDPVVYLFERGVHDNVIDGTSMDIDGNVKSFKIKVSPRQIGQLRFELIRDDGTISDYDVISAYDDFDKLHLVAVDNNNNSIVLTRPEYDDDDDDEELEDIEEEKEEEVHDYLIDWCTEAFPQDGSGITLDLSLIHI